MTRAHTTRKAPEYLAKSDTVKQPKQLVVDTVLDVLYKQHGSVTTEFVLEAARDLKNPLHRYFDWDDSVAAEKWRKQQALSLIMSSKYTLVLDSKQSPPAVLGALPEVRKLLNAFRGEGFKIRKDALANGDSRRALIEKWKERLRSWMRETADIDELSELREALIKLL